MTAPTPPQVRPYAQGEYADDVVSFVAQVRDVAAALRRIQTCLVPEIVFVIDDPLTSDVRPVDGAHTASAWAPHYEIQHVDKLLAAAERLHRDAHLIQRRYDESGRGL